MRKSQKTTAKSIQIELVRNNLESIADGMAVTLWRTSRSAVVRTGWDFSTAILTPEGELAGQGMCHPIHLGGMMPALKGCMDQYHNQISPGDILIVNDPYSGGSHLPDIYLFKPIFIGDILIAYLASIAHHADIGGRVPGGQGFDNTEIFQEGLCIPPMKLFNKDIANESLFRIIEKAVRVPEQVLGDLQSQISSLHHGEKQMRTFLAQLNPETYQTIVNDLLDYSEVLTRQTIRALPEGSWVFTDYVDNDGITNKPIKVTVRLEKKMDEIAVDFEGTSPQCKGSIQPLMPNTRAMVYAVLRSVLGNHIPNNSGVFRPVTVVAPKGSFVNPNYPAGVAARQLGCRRANQAVWGAIAQIIPENVFACPGGADASIATSGYDKTNTPWRNFVLTEGFNETSGGARSDKDGLEGQGANITNQANTPVEILELEYPISILEYSLVANTEGAGRFRGGLAQKRVYRYHQEGTEVRVRSDRRIQAPWGLKGGHNASPPKILLKKKTDEKAMPGKFTIHMNPCDELTVQWCGGGGYGNPLERDPVLVQWDVVEGKITRERAFHIYGVKLDQKNRINHTATKIRRTFLSDL